MKKVKLLHAIWPSLLFTLCAVHSAAAQTFCVYDPLGAGGDYYSMFQDYQLAAKRWGVSLDLKPYTDDAQLDAAFKGGKCDMASMIGMRARAYNQFSGTIDAPGVIENYAQLREVMAVVASPKLGKLMANGGYEVEGVVPVGAGYVMTTDRSINSFERGAGKRVTVMPWDPTQSMMAEQFKVLPVTIDLPHFGDAFNTGKVDLTVVPMVLYKAMELNKGIGSKGGIVRRPLFQFTMQLIGNASKFPPDFGQHSREYMYTQTDHALSLARNLEAAVDSHVWIYAVHNEITEWNTTMRAALEKMTAAGYFDRRMLALIKRVRCKEDTKETDCAPTPQQVREVGRP